MLTQLTRDRVPVIYHDFVVRLPNYTIPLNRLTLAEFNALRLHQRMAAAPDHAENSSDAESRPRANSLPGAVVTSKVRLLERK